MSDHKPENPEIFWGIDENGEKVVSMRLGDLFAATALAHIQRQAEEADCTVTRMDIAAEAYRQADAMLAEREERS